MRGLRALLALVVVAGSGAGLVAAGEATRDEDRTAAQVARAPERVPVVSAGAVCPDVRQVADALVTRVSVGSATTTPSLPGTVAAAPLGEPPVRLPLAEAGGALTDLGGAIAAGALVVEATGGLAPGLEVEALTRGATTASRGLAGLRCPEAGVEQWFVGGGTRVGETSVLVLANPDATPALVDVTAFGEARAADDAPGRGLVVPPGERLLVPLNDLAPDLGTLTVHVEARRGRVAAGVLTSRVLGRIAQGLEWVPAAEAPSRRVVVPGFVQGPGARRLLLSNPGDAPASVALDLTTADGQVSPPELAAIAVPARRSTAVDLTGPTAAGALAVTARATVPVLGAGLAVDRGSGPVADLALTGSATPLTRPALISDLTLAPSIESTLVLSAVDGDAAVTVTAVPVPGNAATVGPPVSLRLPGGSTRTLRLSGFVPPGATARLAVRVEVTAGAVYAARYLRENGRNGPLTTSLALRSGRDRVDRPQVAADLRAGRVVSPAGR